MIKRVLKGEQRQQLTEDLYRKYSKTSGMSNWLIFVRKKYSWLIIIGCAKVIKRGLDIALAGLALLLLSPLLLVIALGIYLTDGRPILYVANRVGKWGEEFRFPKFRSMYVGADKQQAALQKFDDLQDTKRFKAKTDPRITRLGRFLRRTSLDELPQLWCVFKGDMSLIGPRPPLPKEVELYSVEERRRLDVTPGLTCFWQVGGRSEISFEHQVALDVQYIESQSFWGDCLLLLRTIPAIILGKGAY